MIVSISFMTIATDDFSKIMNQISNIKITSAPTAQPSANPSGSQVLDSDNAEPNSAVERPVGLTTFVDAEDTIFDLSHADPTAMQRLLTAPDDEANSIDKVLNRPTFMSNINWTTSQAIGTILANYSVPNDLLNYSSIKTCKVQYNQFMNADVVFRIEASPVQFQAGRLWLCFESYREQRGARAQYGYTAQFTALPGVEYDPAKPAPVELRIPFSSILAAWDLPIGQYGMGTLLVYVLSPLTSASTTASVTLSVQSWLENTKVRVPVQSGLASGPTRRKLDFEFTSGSPMEYQSSEEGMAQRHTFSHALSKISNIATAFGAFPMLSSVATPVAHFSNIASRVAAYFGFAKPADVSAPTKFVSHNRAAWANADGALPLVKLAHSSENAVDNQQNHFPNPIDEMDIKYIVSNPAVLNQWTWATTDAVGKVITVLPVHPGVSTFVTSGTYTFGTFAPTPLAYVASMFKYWAGSIKFKLEAVSTPFHAGRLLVTYIPDYDPLYTGYSINEVGNNYSVVWDITDSSQLDFEVPYLANTPFLSCFLDDQSYTYLKNSETTGVQVRDRVRKVQNGAILVFVLNQLVSPATAASSISVMNWIGGGEDITFAEPVLGAFKAVEVGATRIDYTAKWYDGNTMSDAPYPVVPTRLGEIPECPFDIEMEDEFCYQSAPLGLAPPGIDRLSTATDQRGCYRNFIPMKRIDPQSRARLAAGEVITNLRTLTRRLTPAYAMYPQAVTTAGVWTSTVVPPTSLNVLVFDPDYFGTGDGQDDAAIYNKQIAPARASNKNWLTELESALSYVGRMYVFARGSRLYGISARPSNVINATAFANLSDEITNPTEKGTFEFRLSGLIDEDSPPRQPYFRPEDNLLGYNYANSSSTTLSATNYSYGFNSALSGNFAVEKSGESGCGLVVQVPPTSKYPFKLVATSASAETDYIKTYKYSAPRSRRFLELRYRPFSSTLSGATATYVPKVWPFPLNIMEAGADDFSFGGLMPPPLITKVAKSVVFPNYDTGAKIAL